MKIAIKAPNDNSIPGILLSLQCNQNGIKI